ncbi:MAG: NAD(P)/FAD-dependent oxidoreductase [Planctomycetota bacterium]
MTNIEPSNPRHPKFGAPYKTWRGKDAFDAIVIGSGMGGLTTAALLAKFAFQRVLVLERHYTAGGYTHVFKRPGFEWDVGVHYIGDVHHPKAPLRRLFDVLSEGSLEWVATDDVYDRIIIGEQSFDFLAGQQRFRDRLVEYFPKEASAIDRYLALVNECAKSSKNYFASKALPGFVDVFAGSLMRRPFLNYASRTTLEVLRSLTSDPLLIGVLTGQWGDYGLPPAQSSFGIHAIVVRHYLSGAAYPKGGAAAIAASIAPTIEQAGGEILVNAEVREIVVERGSAVGVCMADGRILNAKTIVSGAGYFNTFDKMLSREVNDRLQTRARRQAVEPSMSHMNLYVGLNGTDRELQLPTTNLWVYPTPDHDANIARFLRDPDQPLPVAYLSFPSAKDPTFAARYPGRSTIQVISLAPYEWFASWENQRWRNRGKDYESLKAKFTARLRDALKQQLPHVDSHIAHCELSTPVSTRHFMNYSHGEPYGLAHTPRRFRQAWLRPRTPIRNPFLTGQDVATAGVEQALRRRPCASAILKKNMLSTIFQPPNFTTKSR